MHHRLPWFPGYTIAGVATVAFIATAPGQTFIISQLNPILRETFAIPELTLNSAYTIATIAAAFPLVLIGAMTDRLGPRRMLIITALLFAIACALTSAVSGLVSVFCAFFLLRFLGQGALSLVSQHAVAMWFHRRLGSVHGIKQVVVFGLWFIFPQLALWLMTTVGWRNTYLIFGALVACSVIPLAFWLMRDRPEEMGLRMDNDPHHHIEDATPDPTGAGPIPEEYTPSREVSFTMREAVRTRAYWILSAIVFFSPLIGTAMLFDLIPIMERRGMTAVTAALATSAWSAAMAITALPSGIATDRIRPGIITAIGITIIGASAIVLMLARTPVSAIAALVLFGIGQSLAAASSSAALARYFGRAHHGVIRSSVTRIGVIGTGIGPVCTGLSIELTGAYNAAMLAFAAVCLPLALICLTMHRPESPSLTPVTPD